MNSKRTHLFVVLAVLLLLLSLLTVGAYAQQNNETHITAAVRHERTLTVTDKTGGHINVSAPDTVHDGDTVTFTVIPDEGYKIKSVWLNGVDVTAQMDGNTFTGQVAGDMEFYAEFEAVAPPLSGDTDVIIWFAAAIAGVCLIVIVLLLKRGAREETETEA